MKNRFLYALPLIATLALPVVAQQNTTPATDQPTAAQQTQRRIRTSSWSRSRPTPTKASGDT